MYQIERLIRAGSLLALGLTTNTLIAAPLENGDFSAGFDGWAGEVIACDDNDCSDTVTNLISSFTDWSDNFSIEGGRAVLSTDATDNPDDLTGYVYSVSLFQELDVDALMGGSSGLLMSFDLSLDLSDTSNDFAWAQLSDPKGDLATIDLLSGVPVDVTRYAGRLAELSFGVEDFDNVQDRLSAGHIGFQQMGAQVPSPAPLLLVVLGLGLVVVQRRGTPSDAAYR